MTKRTKRFFAGLLTSAMLVGSFSMVYADTDGVKEFDGPGSATIKGESVFNENKISVTVPTDISFIINPFGNVVTDEDALKVEDAELSDEGLGGVTAAAASKLVAYKGGTVSGAIISPAYEITNNSDIPIDITLSAVSANSATVDIVGASAKKQKLKSAYLYLQLGSGDDVQKWFTEGKNAKMIDTSKSQPGKVVFTNDTDYKNATKKDGDGKNKIVEVKIPAALRGKAPKKAGELKKAFTVDKGAKAYIRVNGDVNANPFVSKAKDADPDNWTAKDTVQVTYKLNIAGVAAQ